MNPYEIWMDFATRLIKSLDRTPERTEKLLEQIVEYIERYKGTAIVGWDHKNEGTGMYVCDHFSDWFEKYWYIDRHGIRQTNFLRDIACAVRAGLDMATPKVPSGGVLGFTVGTLRKMYPEGIPDHVRNFFDQPLTEDAKDEEGVWL